MDIYIYDKTSFIKEWWNGGDAEYSVSYSPMHYCYNVLSRGTSGVRTEALKNVVKALYKYHQAAKRLFG